MRRLLDDDRNIAALAQFHIMINEGRYAIVHGCRRQHHVGSGLIPLQFTSLPNDSFGTSRSQTNDQWRLPGDLARDDLNVSLALAIGHLIGFAGESIDAKAVYAAVQLEAHDAPQFRLRRYRHYRRMA